jgi:broad specificity phosphatase PhoE
MWQKTVDFSSLGNSPTKSKRIIFIRHGESVWNETFGGGMKNVTGNILKAVMKELSCMLVDDSYLLDTPLNDTGLQQAEELCKFIDNSFAEKEKDSDLSILRGDAFTSSPFASASAHNKCSETLLMSSNLRRALMTGAIALRRLRQLSNQKIIIHSSLQEVSRNVDCVASSGLGDIPNMSGKCCSNAPQKMIQRSSQFAQSEQTYNAEDIFDPCFNFGHKSVLQKGLDRFHQFAEFAFGAPEKSIVVTGHSLYFKQFFDVFLPFHSTHIARHKKMVNCGVVAFTMHQAVHMGKNIHWIDPSSINVVFGGFEHDSTHSHQKK